MFKKTLKKIKNDSPEKTKKEIEGSIDHLDSGILSGWAANMNTNAPIDIAVYSGGVLLGSGKANIFRDDLLKNDIHQGYHGFKVNLDQDLMIEGAKLEVKTLVDSTLINTKPYLIPKLNQIFKVFIGNVVGNRLDFTIESDKPIGNKTLVFSSESEVFTEKEVNINGLRCEEYIYLPAELLDNQTHLIEVGMKGCARILGVLNVQLKPILTPWEYLKESYKQPRAVQC